MPNCAVHNGSNLTEKIQLQAAQPTSQAHAPTPQQQTSTTTMASAVSEPEPEPQQQEGGRPPMQRKRSFLSGVDDFFLQVEGPNQLMTISGMWLFDAPLNHGEVRAEVERLVSRFPRLTQRVSEQPDGRTRWEDDPEFSLD